jgi:hypothetical protein
MKAKLPQIHGALLEEIVLKLLSQAGYRLKSADRRMATEAARLKGKKIMIGRRQTQSVP